MVELFGYADPLTCRPRDLMRVMVSDDRAAPFEATLVRLLGSELGPERPVHEKVVPHSINQRYAGITQKTHIGSYGVVDCPVPIENRFITLACWALPTLECARPQTIMSLTEHGAGISLVLIREEAALTVRGRDVMDTLVSGLRMAKNRWHLVVASINSQEGVVAFQVHPWTPRSGFGKEICSEVRSENLPRWSTPQVTLAATQFGSTPVDHFNGKLEAPNIYVDLASPSAEDVRRRCASAEPAETLGLVAWWDLGSEKAGVRFADLGPQRIGGGFVNCPARSVTGRLWNGTIFDARFAPEQYAAVHFHDDDLADACWNPTIQFEVPADLDSGVYAVKLSRAGRTQSYVPFFVTRREREGARAAILMSTATYIAYGNHLARLTATRSERISGGPSVVSVADLALLKHPEFGLSTYDSHRDGSGVIYASRRRPLLNMKPSGRAWNLALDLCLVDFLHREGIAADVVTDEDLHERGLMALEGYDLVMTGCHPEYYSSAMLDALEGHIDRGGRLMYLGGNGFYWRVAFSKACPGVLEVRRGMEGTRLWTGSVGEEHQSFDGEAGGTWRSLGRSPNSLVGIGYIAQGFDCAAPYRRTAASNDPRVAFMFEGVQEQVLGREGIVPGGAAGLEIDATNPDLGTPSHTLVVAESFGHSNAYVLSVDEIEVNASGTDATIDPRVRAEITFFETDAGGAVFSTGSIAHLGALGANGGANPLARMTLNVIRRFLDREPFPYPVGGCA